MSSTNRGATRRPADYYPTPPWCVRALLRAVPDIFTGLVLDPCAGDGAILRVLRDAGAVPAAIEISPGHETSLRALCGERAKIGDGLALRISVTQVVTNPPFSLTREFIERWTSPELQSAFLLPSSYYRGQSVADWWQGREPARLLQLPRRPAFVAVCKRGGKKGCGRSYPVETRGECVCGGRIAAGTDSQDYLWALWNVDPGPRPIRVLPLEFCE